MGSAMATKNGGSNGGWTLHTYQIHQDSLALANEKFAAERDRRYSEVKQAEEKALKVKEEADKSALGLAREIQLYKDEKANQLREQINSERGTYPTKEELASAVRELTAMIAPLTGYMKQSQGEHSGSSQSLARMMGVVAILAGLSTLGTFVVGLVLLFLR